VSLTPEPYVLVVSLSRRDPMCSLFFAHLAQRAPLRIVEYPGRGLAAALSGAAAVVVIRGLFEFGWLPACAQRLGIPLYYFQDDNFMLIRHESATHGNSYAAYTEDRVRDALRGFDGVLLATNALVAYFRDQGLHDALTLYPPVAGPVLETPAAAPAHALTIAFFGGAHRREPFVKHVFPAVCRLARRMPVTLVAAGVEAGSLPATPGLTVVYPQYDTSYTVALQAVARFGVDILVHPSSPSANNRFKNPHVLINAHVIGATPIFSDEPPYDAVRDEGVALLCGNSEDAWYDALARLADDRPLRSAMQERLARYCGDHFNGDRNAAVIEHIVQRHRTPGALPRAGRRLVAALCLTSERGVRAWKRLVSG